MAGYSGQSGRPTDADGHDGSETRVNSGGMQVSGNQKH